MTGQLIQPGTVTLERPPVAVPTPAVKQHVAALTAGTVGATCNFYAGVDAGAAVRRDRLRRYLTACWSAPVVLVGKAAGYRGSLGAPGRGHHVHHGRPHAAENTPWTAARNAVPAVDYGERPLALLDESARHRGRHDVVLCPWARCTRTAGRPGR